MNKPAGKAKVMRIRASTYIAFAVSLLVALSYPVSVFLNLDSDQYRWLKNEPAFNVFLPFLFSLAVAVFWNCVDLRPLRKAAFPLRIVLVAFLAFLICVIAFSVVSDSKRALPLAPYMLQKSAEALAVEKQFRRDLHSPRNRDFPTHEKGLKLAKQYRDQYMAKFPTFSDFADQRARGSSTSWISMLLNFLAFSFVAFFIWYVVVLFVVGGASKAIVNSLVVVFTLLVLWLPIRLYSEWYANFYSLHHFDSFGAYIVVMIVAVLTLLPLVGLIRPDALVKIFTITAGIVVAVVAATAKLKPEWLWDIAHQIEHLDGALFVTLLSVILLVLLAFAVKIVDGTYDASEALVAIGDRAPEK